MQQVLTWLIHYEYQLEEDTFNIKGEFSVQNDVIYMLVDDLIIWK